MSNRLVIAFIVLGDAALVALGASLVLGVGLLVELAVIFLLAHKIYRPWWERRYGEGRDAEGLP
ncbi:hypothetical protein [Conexibacter woesei]|uniref:Uncharacterized protein n=1 Tax=Conexibacter woesei (strain DSM 14684 / CCUG 47730 / CIP 108061 / JCM 11494 / NBRC 100937 / ID131577) TaxID=469383 RepID=D3FF15_CONWI|nr:hypothetical protein [Conexibacter woesei]ADB51732.1 hypothetical protein Cwoe_3314 [Conexibacter woesei DSM 14684]